MAPARAVGFNVLIPIAEPSLFDSLATEIGRIGARDPGEHLLVFVDAHTADIGHAMDALRAAADRLYVFGGPVEGWVSADNVTVCPMDANPGADRDRFLIVLSSTLNFALVGVVPADPSKRAKESRAGWTCQRTYVCQMAEALLPQTGAEPPVLPERDIQALDASASHAAQLMALFAQQITSIERNTEMDKHDLFSVLEILKAISSKRRSHDVLFVFVEQIARVIEVDRCSVVRIWGGEQVGHVLASHDDETVQDLVISLEKYPELGHSLKTCEKVVISEASDDPLTSELAATLRAARVHSILVIPIVLHDPNIGSLVLRAVRRKKAFSLREISFCEIVAEAASNALERAHLFESIQRANERLEHLAVTDGLTGLHNHRYFRERLEQEFERARRYGLPLSCLIFDIDNFKRINDTYGHLQGDAVLREMAARTVRATRKSDIVARYGGEEFAVVMPQTSVEGARSEAERLLVSLREPPYNVSGLDLNVTVSIGVSVLDHDNMLDCEALIRTADTALYEGKRTGKNRVVIGNMPEPAAP